MKNYDIQQIDYLREKAGITYEEAVELLDRHDGDLARCLVDLERNDLLKGRDGTRASHDPFGRHGNAAGRRPAFVLDWEGVKRFLFSRVLVRKGDAVLSNLTVAFLLFVVLCAPWVALVAIALAVLSGCRIKWVKPQRASAVNFHDFVGQAADSIRRTADSVANAVRPKEAGADDDGKDSGPQSEDSADF